MGTYLLLTEAAFRTRFGAAKYCPLQVGKVGRYLLPPLIYKMFS
jgi:hypothetical protein